MTTTTEVPIAITCPSWCTIDPTEHATQLWNMEGSVIHWSPSEKVASFEVDIATCTTPGGRDTAPPEVFLDGHPMTPQQATALAAALMRTVALLSADPLTPLEEGVK